MNARQYSATCCQPDGLAGSRTHRWPAPTQSSMAGLDLQPRLQPKRRHSLRSAPLCSSLRSQTNGVESRATGCSGNCVTLEESSSARRGCTMNARAAHSSNRNSLLEQDRTQATGRDRRCSQEPRKRKRAFEAEAKLRGTERGEISESVHACRQSIAELGTHDSAARVLASSELRVPPAVAPWFQATGRIPPLEPQLCHIPRE